MAKAVDEREDEKSAQWKGGIWDGIPSVLLAIMFKSPLLSFHSSQSVVAFLKDPEGAPLWEEDPEAKDVVHVDSEKVLQPDT